MEGIPLRNSAHPHTLSVMTLPARPVRVTVELQPAEHRDLRALCAGLADDLGAARVAGAEVFRALLSEIKADPDLRQRVMHRIGSQQ